MLASILLSFFMYLFFFVNSKFKWYCMGWSFLFMFFMILPYFYSSLGISYVFFEFFVDSFSISLALLSCWICSLMIIGSWNIFVKNLNKISFSLVVSVLNLLIILMFMQKNMFILYLFFESSLIPTMILILMWGYQPERLQAGMYFIIYTVVGALPFLLSLVFLFKSNGHLTMLLEINFPFFYSDSAKSLWWVFLLLAFLIKLPIFSVHLWLPKAHVEAPVAGSMILAALLLKLGGYGLVRMILIFPKFNSEINLFFISLGLVGGVITSFICLRQVDMKSLIAYSSIGHMGMMVSGVLSSTYWGISGGVMMMVGHAFSSSGLFYLANLIYEKSNSRSMLISKGFLSIVPGLSLSLFLLCSVNMAAPPSLNLLSEISLIISVLYLYFWYFIPLGIMSFLAGVYSLFLYSSTQHGKISSFVSPFCSMKMSHYMLVLLHWAPAQLLVFFGNSFF
uniref:NADH-ubiquinone oxidoreductase chain 4 n=1 Tax=Lepidozona coreanica TaxID=55527 RepID=A0A6G9DWI4_9MOLL|nr:NADH dehydrogenase subunit 4 [Lepidozona coreanica]QIP53384.1 NADH dehydrogenase subunit 4 [Lepidozona coreanica]